METAQIILTPEAEEIQTKALTIPEKAKAIVITDAGSYVKASELWNSIRAMRKKVADTFDPMIAHWHQGHRLAIKKKSEIDMPLESAEKYTKGKMNTWEAGQECIRKAGETRLREEDRKREEDTRLAAAIEAEKAGDKEEAEAILEEPVQGAPVVVPKTVPKIPGGPVFRTIWKHQVVDLIMLVKAVAAGQVPLAAIKADDVFLGQQARSLKGALRIPGVEVYSERC